MYSMWNITALYIFNVETYVPEKPFSTLFSCTNHINTPFKKGTKSSVGSPRLGG